MTTPFPKTPTFMTIDEPFRFEGELFDLEVEGKVPTELDGWFFQVGPDPQYPPMMGDANPFNGDGIVRAFRIKDGHVDFQHRYVRTHRFNAERAARRSLFGHYRNPYTDDASVRNVPRTVSNTNIVPHAGKLLAMKEDGLPYTMDPFTLETEQMWDWNGNMKATSFTAHPKIDPATGDLVGYAYAAKGDCTKDIAYYTFDKQGKVTREVWFEGPHAAMIHDCGITEKYIVLPIIPSMTDLDRLKAGGIHFQWDASVDQVYAVLPRDGDAKDVRFFRAPNAFPGHVINSFDVDDKVYLDLPVVNDNVFWFFPDAQGKYPPPSALKTEIVRWCFDMNSKSDTPTYKIISTLAGEFPHIDDRYIGRPYRHAFLQVTDMSQPYNEAKAGPIMGFFFNTYTHMDMSTGQTKSWFAGDTSSTQEPVFAPKSPTSAEGEGYMMGVVNRRAENRSDLVILDAQRVDEGPVAVVKLPVRMKYGIHGNWVPASEFNG
ncbi:MAG: carotenoid oxygenase family protein [Gammaproteobacteria bacterium]|nr:carotenoid oxygenase family protein [Gammaproteobacteria bacterium]